MKLREFLQEKRDAGIKQVRVATVLAKMEEDDEAAAALTSNGKPASLDLVGTAEAAEILGVERPRIGRWRKYGVMPDPVAELKAGPVWYRTQIVGMKGEREKRRRGTAAATT